jgi:hypothetical protein
MKSRTCLVAAWAAVLSGPATAQSPDQAALGAWALERSPARCVISRKYGPAADPVTLGFKAPPIGDALQIVIVRPDSRTIVTQTDAKIAIEGEIVRTNALSYPVGRDLAAHLINLTGDNSAVLRRASELRVEVKGAVRRNKGLRRSFSLGPIASSWGQLDSCLVQLRQTWNMGKDFSQLTVAARPIVPLEKLFSSADYPRVALRQLQSGTSGIMLLIDESGAVKDCTLTQASGVAVLDSRTCGLIVLRGKFQPAIGPDGKPAKSAYFQRITWGIEKG